MPINNPKNCPYKRSHKLSPNNDDLYVTTHKRCEECKEQEPCLADSYLTFKKQLNSKVPEEKPTIESYTVYVNLKPKAERMEEAEEVGKTTTTAQSQIGAPE